MAGPCRPTLRCLREDLAPPLPVVEALRGPVDEWPEHLLPLYAMDVDIVQKAAEKLPPVDGEPVQTISGLHHPTWVKVRAGQRDRGAAVECEGQYWLTAAGMRFEEERGRDFYPLFMKRVKARGAAAFTPTAEDWRLLRREQAFSLRQDWRDRVRRIINDAIRAVLRERHEVSVDVPSLEGGAIGRVTIVCYRPEATDGKGRGDEVEVMVEQTLLDHRLTPDWIRYVVEWVRQCIWPVPEEWDTEPYEPLLNCLTVEQDALEAWANGDIDDAEILARPVAHYAHRADLAQQYVEGRPVRALCSKWFIPRRDPAPYPVCPSCQAIYTRLPAGDAT